jgi:drug/metabolite transporter (DMT)-like permease
MNSYQPLVPPSRAALIYLLEAVFAAGFSVMLNIDDLTRRLVLGGALIIVGNVLVEVPGWIRGRAG